MIKKEERRIYRRLRTVRGETYSESIHTHTHMYISKCIEKRRGKKKKVWLLVCISLLYVLCSRAAGAGCPVAPSEKVNVRE